MKQALILASSRIQFIHFIRNFGLNSNDFKFVSDGSVNEVCGYHWDTPVILLEEYQYNKNYTLEIMRYIGHRFNNIGFLSIGEIYNGN